MKTTSILTLLTIISINLNAQWNPSGATTGDIYYNNGNVGLGLTNPSFGLSIFSNEDQTTLGGNTKSVVRLMNNYANAFGRRSEIQFGLGQLSNELLAVIAAEYSSWDGFVGGDLLFATTPTNSGTVFERMRINRNGNVGIGTSDPIAQLHLASNDDHGFKISRASGFYGFRIFRNAQSGNVYFQNTDDNNVWGTRTAMAEGGSAWENLILNPNGGNVGIGTTNPGNFKLAVEGKIGTSEVVVTLERPWPDYVFEDNYQPMDLVALEKFITVNNHLPEVPSAADIKENGLSLGEMNAILLKKIEELTLVLIDQEKRIKMLEHRATPGKQD